MNSKKDAVLWLWESHNEVNDRLKADETEDPEFPKIQFPSKESCPTCLREPMFLPITNKLNWNKQEVFAFLRNIYKTENINRYGLNSEGLIQKASYESSLKLIFSSLDLTMGMLLYGFCFVMLIVALKLFVNRGYRKKFEAYKI